MVDDVTRRKDKRLLRRLTVNCKICNKQISIPPCRINIKHYCSRGCLYENRRREGCPWAFKEHPIKQCKTCNKKVRVIPARINTASFCSRKCYNIYQKENPRPSYWNKKERITKSCERCGKNFSGVPWEVKKRRFCGHVCSGASAVRKMLESRRFVRPSIFQKSVFEQIKILYPNSSMEYRIKNWFIDIFIPDKNLCIECDGSYWHRGKEEQDRLRQLEIEDLGYRVVRVPELEWYKHRNIFRYI